MKNLYIDSVATKEGESFEFFIILKYDWYSTSLCCNSWRSCPQKIMFYNDKHYPGLRMEKNMSVCFLRLIARIGFTEDNNSLMQDPGAAKSIATCVIVGCCTALHLPELAAVLQPTIMQLPTEIHRRVAGLREWCFQWISHTLVNYLDDNLYSREWDNSWVRAVLLHILLE